MEYTLLHSKYDEASRQFIQELNIILPDVDDFYIAKDGLSLRVITEHEQAVAYCNTFSKYPVFIFKPNTETTLVLNAPSTWQECLDFCDAPWPKDNGDARFTKLDFMYMFKEEWNSIKQAAQTDGDVGLIYDSFILAEFISLKDQRTMYALNALVLKGLITQSKLDEVLNTYT